MSENANKVKEAKRRLNITLSSFTMFATPRTRKDRKQIRLTYGCTNGYPNVNIETDEEGEPTLENGFLRLSSRLNGVNFFAFLNLIESALQESPGWSRGIECYHTYKDGEGLMARCICHELDHLDGHMYTEKVEGGLHDVNYEEPEEE